MDQDADMIPVELSRIVISENSNNQVIWLKEQDGERSFPILIGLFEAMAIERNVKQNPYVRPLTHDLLVTLLDRLGGSLDRVEITQIKDATFYANLVISRDGETIELDCRPSDAIALSTGLDSPLFVADAVFDEIGSQSIGPIPGFDLFDDTPDPDPDGPTE